MPSTTRRRRPSLPQRRRLSNLTFSLIIVAVLVVGIGAMFLISRASAPDTAGDAATVAVREDSNRLSTAPGSTVQFVEFLDFECEACGAAYPLVEQLRAEYADRVDFVIRYFPIAAHFNSERAARAVEAAARQGRLEEMYSMMYETQPEWGEQQVPLDDRFRGYAQRIGLDMALYDTAYADPAVLERIRADQQDGYALGVQGTPTFFVNGQRLEARSYADMTAALDAALAEG